MKSPLIVVRGAGDLATGTIHKLHSCGFFVLALETAAPSAIRRCAAFSEAVYTDCSTVEGVTCRLAGGLDEVPDILNSGEVPLLIDPEASCLDRVKPAVLVDAILAKRNLGTHTGMAPTVIALGPGFSAPEDAHVVIETMRGHDLGRLIRLGSALPDTGMPGLIAGAGAKRVVHSPAAGVFRPLKQITDVVREGEPVAEVEDADGTRIPVPATMDGLLRGLLREGYPVTQGFKVADIDPRLEERDNCFTISDKARCIAGGVLEAVLWGICRERKEREAVEPWSFPS